MNYTRLKDAFNGVSKLLFPEEWDGCELDIQEKYSLFYEGKEVVGLNFKLNSSLTSSICPGLVLYES